MDKEIVKLLIAEYQQKVVEVSLQERPYIMEDKLNYVFVGLRRVGKNLHAGLLTRITGYMLPEAMQKCLAVK